MTGIVEKLEAKKAEKKTKKEKEDEKKKKKKNSHNSNSSCSSSIFILEKQTKHAITTMDSTKPDNQYGKC